MSFLTRTASIIGLVLAAILAAPSTSVGQGTGNSIPDGVEPVPCPFFVPLNETARCALFHVPARTAGDGRQIQPAAIFFAILDSYALDPERDPVVQIAGGPGQGASLFAGDAWDRTATIRARRHVMFIDQRGTGLSRPLLACPELRHTDIDDDRLNDLPSEDGAGPLRQRVAACRDRLVSDGIDLTAFGTHAAALDIATLRKALGIPEWTLIGTSYGTKLVREIARVDPDGIKAMVLNSPMTSGAFHSVARMKSRNEALDRIMEDCAMDKRCNAAFPGLASKYKWLGERMERKPITLMFRHPVTGVLIPQVVDFEAFTSAMADHIAFRGGEGLAPQMIWSMIEVAEGRLSLTDDQIAGIFNHPWDDKLAGMALGLHLSVSCREFWPLTDQAAIAREVERNPLYNGDPLEIYNVACPIWNAGKAEPDLSTPLRSDVPTLILTGRYDSLTPTERAEQVARHLPQAEIIRFFSFGHDLQATNGCARHLISTFVTDPEKPLDKGCVDRHPADFFVSDRRMQQLGWQ